MTDDDKELVTLLRDRKIVADTDPWLRADDLCVEAAHRIEAQAAEIEQLRMQLKAAALWTAEPGTTVAEIRAAFGETE